MNNIFENLPLYEENEKIIENDNQLKNRIKLLNRKKEKYDLNPLPSLEKEIQILQWIINEYNNKEITFKKNSKKSENIKKSLYIKKMDIDRKNKKLNIHKNNMKNQQIKKLWKNNTNPKWCIKNHKLFPSYDKKGIFTLLLGSNRKSCILNILPNDIILYILSNIYWDWFYIDKNNYKIKRKRKKKKKLKF